jgi:hypothetical protein
LEAGLEAVVVNDGWDMVEKSGGGLEVAIEGAADEFEQAEEELLLSLDDEDEEEEEELSELLPLEEEHEEEASSSLDKSWGAWSRARGGSWRIAWDLVSLEGSDG